MELADISTVTTGETSADVWAGRGTLLGVREFDLACLPPATFVVFFPAIEPLSPKLQTTAYYTRIYSKLQVSQKSHNESIVTSWFSSWSVYLWVTKCWSFQTWGSISLTGCRASFSIDQLLEMD